MAEFAVGDRVTWNTPQGRTSGRIVDRRDRDFTFANQRFRASVEEPAFLVESDTGAQAAHHGDALESEV